VKEPQWQNTLTKDESNRHRLILNAPDGYQQMPIRCQGASVQAGGAGEFDVVQVFVRSKADLDARAPEAIRALRLGGVLWFAFPRKSSKVKTDINRDAGWETVSAAGLEPVTAIATDETWSALRFRPSGEIKARKKG
jgi:hypothetical protein